MSDVLTKLAEIASQLDEAGHKKQADQVDLVLIRIASELSATAESNVFFGQQSMSDEEKALMQSKTPGKTLPASVKGKLVVPSKTNKALGYGFFSANQIEKAVKDGSVDQNAAINSIKEYLSMFGKPSNATSFPQAIMDLLTSAEFPNSGSKPVEVYGEKSFWQRMLGR